MLPAPLPLVLGTVFLFVNGVAFMLFAADKRRAAADAWRVPEATLLGCAALGPFGAFAAMRMFCHKTKKWKFFLVPVFLVSQIALFLLFAFTPR